MATTALGIRPDGDNRGVSPSVHRHIISAQWNNDGIIQGLGVTGRSDLTYQVGAGTALIQPDGQSGEAVLAYWPGGQTPAVSAGNAGLPRYDVIWLRAHDLDKGDSDNHVVVGVTQGTPAADPDLPLDQVPSDVVRLTAMYVPAGMTQTRSSTTTGAERWAMPYGASKGLLGRNVRNYEGPANMGDGGKDYYEQDTKFYLPTDRLIELRFTATACACTVTRRSRPRMRRKWPAGMRDSSSTARTWKVAAPSSKCPAPGNRYILMHWFRCRPAGIPYAYATTASGGAKTCISSHIRTNSRRIRAERWKSGIEA